MDVRRLSTKKYSTDALGMLLGIEILRFVHFGFTSEFTTVLNLGILFASRNLRPEIIICNIRNHDEIIFIVRIRKSIQ